MIYAAVCAVNGKFKRKGCNTLQVKKCKPVPYKHRVRGSQGIFARKAFPKRLTGTEARLIALRAVTVKLRDIFQRGLDANFGFCRV